MVGAVALFGLGDGVAHTTLFAARVIRIHGLHHVSRAEVLVTATLASAPPLVDVGASSAARLAAIPWVRHATVRAHFPDSVTVSIIERRAVAAVARPGGSGRFALVDPSGWVVASTQSLPAGVVVVQSATTPPTPGHPMRGPHGVFRVAAQIPSSWRDLVTKVAEGPHGTVSLTLSTPVSVALGPPSDLQAKFEAVAALLANGTLASGSHLDVSVPSVPEVSG